MAVRDVVRRWPLVSFFVLAYALSWTAWLPYLLSENALGLLPLRFPTGFPIGGLVSVGPGAYLGPAGAAFAVTALAEGRAGLRVWWARLTRWRVARRWYAFALLGYPALVLMALVATAAATQGLRAPSTGALVWFVPGLVLQALTSGLAEEPGWRDFAQPRIQHEHGPLRGTLLLGLLWGGWHLPLFLTDWAPGGTGPASIAGFLLGSLAFSVVIAWAFNGSGQSLPISILLHAGSNNVVTMLAPSVLPGAREHAGFLSPSLLAAVMVAVVLIVATRGRLGLPAAAGTARRPAGSPTRGAGAAPRAGVRDRGVSRSERVSPR